MCVIEELTASIRLLLLRRASINEISRFPFVNSWNGPISVLCCATPDKHWIFREGENSEGAHERGNLIGQLSGFLRAGASFRTRSAA